MFFEEYGIYVIVGLVFAALMIGMLIAEVFIVRANRKLIRESTREMAALLAQAGKPEEGRRLAQAIDEVLREERKQVMGRLKRHRALRRER